jgi:DNA-binding MarR family transcriptional regulator
MSALAEQAMMTSGGLTRLADRLERDGLIARTRSTDDLRGYEARITPAGRKALRRANRQHLADVRELFLDHVTQEELEVLAGVWRRVKAANAELSQTASRSTRAASERGSHRTEPSSRKWAPPAGAERRPWDSL